MLTVKGDSRVYLVQDHREVTWASHKYVRIDLQSNPLVYTLDLSRVPCGCTSLQRLEPHAQRSAVVWNTMQSLV